MLTIFTIPKPFIGQANIIQRNAIQSWLRLVPPAEIILFGDDQGVAQASAEFSVRHAPDVKKTEFGTPLLDDVFRSAKKLASYPFLAYINSDIILLPGDDFSKKIGLVDFPRFLMSGRRWDVDIKEAIGFDETTWENNLRDLIARVGKRHGFSGMDYFIFPRDLDLGLPSFAVGRPGWDSWLVYRMRSLKIPVIDATLALTILHQNHDYSHSLWGKKKKVKGPETAKNIKLAGGFSRLATLRDANWLLTPEGLKRPEVLRRILARLTLFYPWRLALAIRRKLMF